MSLAFGFQLYPLIPSETMSQMLAISSGCLDALQVIVSEKLCDQKANGCQKYHSPL